MLKIQDEFFNLISERAISWMTSRHKLCILYIIFVPCFLRSALTQGTSVLSCRDRCALEFVVSHECHCNVECVYYGDCCRDFFAECKDHSDHNDHDPNGEKHHSVLTHHNPDGWFEYIFAPFFLSNKDSVQFTMTNNNNFDIKAVFNCLSMYSGIDARWCEDIHDYEAKIPMHTHQIHWYIKSLFVFICLQELHLLYELIDNLKQLVACL